MKDCLLAACDQIDVDLQKGSPSLHDVLEKDCQLMMQLEEFKGGLNADQQEQWNELERSMDFMRDAARVMALSSATEQEVEEMRNELQELRETANRSKDYEEAMVEIERQAHRADSGLKEVVKTFFMWKRSPEEFVEGD